MTTVTFQEVTLLGFKTVKCEGGCGRRLQRKHKFWQTLSPFNKNAQGQLKSYDEIMAQLRQERDRWLTTPETCIHC